MTDTATLDRPCAWYACLDQATAGRLFCDDHEQPLGPLLRVHFEDGSAVTFDPEDSPYHDLADATEDDPRL